MQALFDLGDLLFEQPLVQKAEPFGSAPHAPSPRVDYSLVALWVRAHLAHIISQVASTCSKNWRYRGANSSRR
jgi:hypothetical protein